MSIRKYALERAGVSHTAVRKWIASGMPTAPDGKVDPDAADAWRAANLIHPVAVGPPEREPKPAAVQTPPLPDPPAPPPAGVVPPDEPKEPKAQPQPNQLTLARTEREQLRVQREEIRLQQDRNELIPAREVEATWAALVVAAQNALLNVSEKAAGRVARSRDEAECRSIIDREIREALAILSHKVAEMAAA